MKKIILVILLISSANDLFAQCPPITGLYINGIKNGQVSFKWNGVLPAGTQYSYDVNTTGVNPTTPTTTPTLTNLQITMWRLAASVRGAQRDFHRLVQLQI